MPRKAPSIAALLASLAWTASSWAHGDVQSVLRNVSQSLGADDLTSIQYSGSGFDFALGQAPNVKSPWSKFNVKAYTRTVSFDPWASRLERTRTQFENPPRGGGGQPIAGEQKQTKELVNTHSHFDHLGGVRAYVAEGATMVTHESNQAYYRAIWANPHTLAPDRLAKSPRPPKIKPVGDKLTLNDGDHVVELHHLKNFGHHDGALVAYLPKEKILVEADAFNTPAAPLTQTPAVISPNNRSLVANIERLKLDVQRIVPVHLPADNRKITLAELLTAVGKH